jgi:hypothetical protein
MPTTSGDDGCNDKHPDDNEGFCVCGKLSERRERTPPEKSRSYGKESMVREMEELNEVRAGD